MIDLNEAAQDALATARKREKKGQLKSDTMSLLKHCAGEVCEASMAYTLYLELQGECEPEALKRDFADELADIITCALIAAAEESVDIEAALLRVQEKNALRCK